MSLLYKGTLQLKPSLLQKVAFYILLCTSFVVPLFALQMTQNPLSTPRLYLFYILVLFAGLCWVLDIVLQKQLTLRNTIIDIPLLLILGVFTISSIFSVGGGVSYLGKMHIFVLNLGSIVAFCAWAWLLLQMLGSSRRWQLFVQSLLLGGVVQTVLFLLQDVQILQLDQYITGAYNLFSASNMLFGMYVAVMGVLAFGMLLIKRQHGFSYILPLVLTILSFVCLVRIGFDMPFIIYAIGLGTLIIIGSTFLADVFSSVLVTQFALFVITILLIIFGIPSSFQTELPVEITLGNSVSYSITSKNVLSGVKDFMIGTGPGTFLYAFSEHRTASFNMNPVVWSLRFDRPYNSFYALVTETGVLGALAVVTLCITLIGAIFGAWMKTRPGVWKEQLKHEDIQHVIRLQVFVLAAAFVAYTAAHLFAYFDVAGWFIWWTLLAIVVAGLSSLVPTIITEKRISLQVSPQYSLVMSFGMVVISTGIILLLAFGGRIFLADVAYAKALRAANLDETEQQVDKALGYRAAYGPYMIAQARVSLERARRETRNTEPNVERVTSLLATAVNTAKNATDLYPNDIVSWDTLATMYLNTQSVVPGANEWAIQSLARAIALEPTNPVLHWQLGNAHVFAGNMGEAEESYKKAIKLKPDYIIAYISLADLLESLERYDQAISLYQPIFPVVQNNAEALFNLGRLYYNRGAENDLERAKLVLEQSVNINPDYANALYTLGLVYESIGDTSAALIAFEKVLELNPDNTELPARIERVKNAGASISTQNEVVQ